MNPGTSGIARKPTLKDVATLAGVSPMTASRVVAGSPGVSPDLAKRVRSAVKRLGYNRNEAARLLRPGQRSGLLGVIITNIDNPYYAQVLLGIESAAQSAGRLIITGISHNDPALEAQLVHDLVARHIDGLIVVPASADAPHLAAAAASGVPLVLASRSIQQGGADTILVDDVGGASRAVADLLAEGRHPVAFIGGPDAIATAARRYEGYALAHTRAGLEPRPELALRLPPDRDVVAAQTRALLELPEPPRAFFTTNNRYTVAVLRVLLEAHRGVADPPPLAGFDTFELADLVPYPLRLIEHDALALGRLAAELTIRRIEGGEQNPPVTTTLPSTSVISGSQSRGSLAF